MSENIAGLGAFQGVCDDMQEKVNFLFRCGRGK